MRRVLYPGSFDPVTCGHLDVAKRAATIFDEVLVAVAANSDKKALFSIEERMELFREASKDIPNIRVVTFKGLMVKAVNDFKADAVIRGIRAASDFEYEFQMALMNRELSGKCETLFMMTDPAYSFVSSRLIKEIAANNGEYSNFVPPCVVEALRAKMKEKADSAKV